MGSGEGRPGRALALVHLCPGHLEWPGSPGVAEAAGGRKLFRAVRSSGAARGSRGLCCVQMGSGQAGLNLANEAHPGQAQKPSRVFRKLNWQEAPSSPASGLLLPEPRSQGLKKRRQENLVLLFQQSGQCCIVEREKGSQRLQKFPGRDLALQRRNSRWFATLLCGSLTLSLEMLT